MDARSILARLRRNETPSTDELTWFAQGLADQSVSDAQAGAFAMAVCKGGLGDAGRTALTLAMRDSGDVLNWNLDGPIVDKHSTGGIGDSTSFIVAPALAACGAFAPLLSGRGLGHTGGTLDKIEAIPGVTAQISSERLASVVDKAGCAIVGATAEIAPADKRLYAIRDVTATVESLDLITASILSKKLAAGTQVLALDVKMGSGAFMKTREEAEALARALTDTANAAGCRTRALISDMNQPLAPALGNALEIDAVMQVLTGTLKGPLLELSAELGGLALKDAGLATSDAEGAAAIRAAIADGRAAEHFGRMISAMGGPLSFVEDWRRFLPEANVIVEAEARAEGYVMAIDGEALGLAVVAMGGGRRVETDSIDPAVGLSQVVRLGEKVDAKTPLAVIHAAREETARRTAGAVRDAITIGPAAPKEEPLVRARIG